MSTVPGKVHRAEAGSTETWCGRQLQQPIAELGEAEDTVQAAPSKNEKRGRGVAERLRVTTGGPFSCQGCRSKQRKTERKAREAAAESHCDRCGLPAAYTRVAACSQSDSGAHDHAPEVGA